VLYVQVDLNHKCQAAWVVVWETTNFLFLIYHSNFLLPLWNRATIMVITIMTTIAGENM
jgi:hypothetical protein